jgi:hypothetical protein
MVVEQSNNPLDDAGPLDTVMIDDLSHAEMRIVILRELLRTIGLQGAYLVASKGKPRVSSEASLAILRLVLTLISRPDPDTIFSAAQSLNALEESFNPQQKRGAFTNNIMGYVSISRVLQYVAGFATADAFLPATDKDEYLRLAIDDLANLIPNNKVRSYLRYAHENLIIEVPPVDRFWDTPLWADEFSVPSEPKYWNLNNHPKALTLLNFFRKQPEIWRFWEDWYSGYLNGKPMDKRLLEAVAKITDGVWEAGPEAVATEIEKLREARSSSLNEQPLREEAYEPKSVSPILANPAVATASFQSVAQNISVAFETFHRETGINQVPASFMPLHAVPQLLVGMGRILQRELNPTAKEQALREEVGRLNARIAELEAALEAALASSDPIVSPAFKEQLGKSLGDWKLYAGLVAGLWIVSGDDIGLQKRSENILNLRESLFGDVCPAPQVQSNFGTMT